MNNHFIFVGEDFNERNFVQSVHYQTQAEKKQVARALKKNYQVL